jgi:hypothetical protein
MGKMEKIVLAEPPAPQVRVVLEHLHVTKRALAALEAQISETAFAAAVGKPCGAENLAALREKIATAKFAIENYPQVRAHAERQDEQAVVQWKAEVQKLPPEQIIAGITKDSCCRRCTDRTGCALTGIDPLSHPCAHPVLVGALELTRYRDNEKIQRIYDAACRKLGLMRRLDA